MDAKQWFTANFYCPCHFVKHSSKSTLDFIMSIEDYAKFLRFNHSPLSLCNHIRDTHYTHMLTHQQPYLTLAWALQCMSRPCKLMEVVCQVPSAMQSDCEICFCTICLLSSQPDCHSTAHVPISSVKQHVTSTYVMLNNLKSCFFMW